MCPCFLIFSFETKKVIYTLTKKNLGVPLISNSNLIRFVKPYTTIRSMKEFYGLDEEGHFIGSLHFFVLIDDKVI